MDWRKHPPELRAGASPEASSSRVGSVKSAPTHRGPATVRDPG